MSKQGQIEAAYHKYWNKHQVKPTVLNNLNDDKLIIKYAVNLADGEFYFEG
jgi:hypothetical protein